MPNSPMRDHRAAFTTPGEDPPLLTNRIDLDTTVRAGMETLFYNREATGGGSA